MDWDSSTDEYPGDDQRWADWQDYRRQQEQTDREDDERRTAELDRAAQSDFRHDYDDSGEYDSGYGGGLHY